jgi:hypothetical protein
VQSWNASAAQVAQPSGTAVCVAPATPRLLVSTLQCQAAIMSLVSHRARQAIHIKPPCSNIRIAVSREHARATRHCRPDFQVVQCDVADRVSMAAVLATPCCSSPLPACSRSSQLASPGIARRDTSHAGPAATSATQRSSGHHHSRRSASVCSLRQPAAMAAVAAERASISGRLNELRKQQK